MASTMETAEREGDCDSPEYQAMIECTPLLVMTISQDPQAICDKMISESLTSRELLSNVRMPTITSDDKARMIVDTMTGKIEHHAQYFDVFIRILQSVGMWTSDLVTSLLKTRRRCNEKRE